jgi:hypothetical protein
MRKEIEAEHSAGQKIATRGHMKIHFFAEQGIMQQIDHRRGWRMNHLKGWQWQCHTSKGANCVENGRRRNRSKVQHFFEHKIKQQQKQQKGFGFSS